MAIVMKDGVNGKICSKCKQWKPVSAFRRRQLKGDGYQGECRVCSNASNREWKKTHTEKIREANRVYYEAHREYHRAYGETHREKLREYGRAYRKANATRESTRARTWQKANPDKLAGYKRSHRETHREQIRAQQRKWTGANRDRVRVYRQRRRTREVDNGGSFSATEWAALKARCDYTCLRCGKREPEIALTPDHIIPVAKGGSSDISNIQPLCGSCNSAKGANSTDYRLQAGERRK